MRAMADHLAGLGYAVLLPDVYYRDGQLDAVRRRTPCSPTRPSGSG